MAGFAFMACMTVFTVAVIWLWRRAERRLLLRWGYCVKCKQRFSDWFVWGGVRHCYPCWEASGYTRTVLDTGEVIRTPPPWLRGG